MSGPALGKRALVVIAAAHAAGCTGAMINSPPDEHVTLVDASPPVVVRNHWTATTSLEGANLRVVASAEPMCVVATAIEVRRTVQTSEAERPGWIIPQSLAAVALIGGGIALEAVSGRFSNVPGKDAMTGDTTASPRVAARVWGAVSIGLGGWAAVDASAAIARSGEHVLRETKGPASNVPVPCPPGPPRVFAGDLTFASPQTTMPLGTVQPGVIAYFDLTPLVAPGTSQTVGDAGRLEIAGQAVAQLDLRSVRASLGLLEQRPVEQPRPEDGAGAGRSGFDASHRDEAVVALAKAVAGEIVRRWGEDSPGGLGFVFRVGGTLLRDAGIEEGIRLVLPDANERQIGLLTRILGNIAEGDLSVRGMAESAFREKIVNDLKDAFPDGATAFTVMDFLWDVKVRAGE